jgi:hypothetical protein
MKLDPVAIIAGATFGGLGLWTVCGGSRNIIFGLLSRKWPTTPGTIIKSTVKHVGNGSYIADIQYAYSLSKHAYIGNQLGFGKCATAWNATSLKKAKTMIAEYPLDSKVEIYYNPNNNHKSVLTPGLECSQFFVLAIGIIWAIFGLGAFLL